MYRPTEISTSDPTVNSDFSAGFRQGNGWLNTTDDSYYICEDDTEGAAVWTSVGGTSEITDWQDWTPTFVSSPAVTQSPSAYVARYITIGDKVNFILDFEGANDSGSTITGFNVTLPTTPRDVNAVIPCSAYASDSSKSTPSRFVNAMIDADTNLKLYITILNINNAADYRVIVSGFYEIST